MKVLIQKVTVNVTQKVTRKNEFLVAKERWMKDATERIGNQFACVVQDMMKFSQSNPPNGGFYEKKSKYIIIYINWR